MSTHTTHKPAGALAQFALPINAHAEPGSQLKSYPQAGAKGLDKAQGSTQAETASAMVLGQALAASKLDPAGVYALKDPQGRVLCVDGAGSGTWNWAFMGQYTDYPQDVLPLSVSSDPTQGPANLSIQSGGLSWPLHANGKSSNWEWTFWASSGYGEGYPVMGLSAQLSQTNPDGSQSYKLAWNNAGTTMHLAADAGSWNWLYVSGSNAGSQYTFHKFFVIKNKVEQLFQSTWPGSSFVYSAFNTGDEFYEAISDTQAGTIYQESGLRNYKWKNEVFDCDDFSYVYKAQASKTAYASSAEFGYAIGVIFGRTSTGAHAVNVFVDTRGQVRIIEPQTGGIVAGKDWKDGNGEAYKPYFVLM